MQSKVTLNFTERDKLFSSAALTMVGQWDARRVECRGKSPWIILKEIHF